MCLAAWACVLWASPLLATLCCSSCASTTLLPPACCLQVYSELLARDGKGSP
jgi:hypothetical protein